MDNVKVNEDLSVLISDLTRIEQDKLMLMATIYTRKNEEIKQCLFLSPVVNMKVINEIT